MRDGRFPRSGILVLALGGIYFLVPIAATIKFSLFQGNAGFSFGAYTQILKDPLFRHTLWFSVQLALETTVVTMLLMVPTVYWVHLRLRGSTCGRARLDHSARDAADRARCRPARCFPRARARVVDRQPEVPRGCLCRDLSPVVYRALDAGIRAVDIHTLTDAAQSLGASRTRTLLRVILPNLRGAVAIACLLCFVIVLGEYTIASIALWETFPVYITFIGTSQAYAAAALSIISVVLTFGAALVFVMLARIGVPRGGRSRPILLVPGRSR